MAPPLVSVITINRNNATGLARTLASSAAQSCTDFEHIVIDGASTDGSVDLLRNGSFKVHVWTSEPDRGIYDAMNKGIKTARGRYLLFLNSGDEIFAADSLKDAASVVTGHDIYYFDLDIRGAAGGTPAVSQVKTYPQELTFSFFGRDSLPHQSSFIKADLFRRVGLYDEAVRIGADWKHFLLSVCRHNCSYQYTPMTLGVFYADGISSDPANTAELRRERAAVLHTEFPAFVSDLEYVYHARLESATLQALRQSRIIRALQRINLLWKF